MCRQNLLGKSQTLIGQKLLRNKSCSVQQLAAKKFAATNYSNLT